ncbi:hypothetical protein JCM9140_3902 [Halalkalibacter wakoensis JCM 9140]|uniref:Oxidoreductase n=1 Tax=Halalkalibacter wakoensis JCM 9140 TaxID=1236970 RepID=W4Q700_9BACI|nr:Gfo/Idh/MocA family oxidoreductase [Halalkalibacter wakoensis]GAE27745.1 hypothetical protein JCM9140_3902 [Halalkalibacter wakoensis JCM 9140]
MTKKVKVAVVGVGRVGISHIEGVLKSPDLLELAGVVELNKALADSVAKKYNTIAYYSLTKALTSNVDAFIVCLPHHLHYPVGKQVLEAGKHVLIEKPLGINLEEVESLNLIAQQNNVIVMSAQSRRYFKAIQQAREYLPVIDGPTNLLYNFACIFTRDSAPPWWREESKSGGLVLGMLGSHSIDMTLWMNEGKKPVRVYCETRNITEVFEGDDAATVVITFDDGTIATNYLSICNAPIKHECLIEGKKGSIFFEHVGDHEGVVGAASTNVYINGERIETDDEPDCFTNQVRELASSIIEARQPLTSGSNVYNTYVLIEAAKESAKSHIAIDINEFIKLRN